MNFKYSCFTENTPEMREWLEKIGYKSVIPFTMPILYTFLYDGIGYYQSTLSSDNALNIIKENIPLVLIDCRSNPELFKALTALREDSDYMQWYYSSDHEEKNWWLSDRQVVKVRDRIINNEIVWHKATSEELKEHFKKGE